MKGIRLKGSGGLERLTLVEMDEPGAPQKGEILVGVHASSLNYHDYLVALGDIATAGRTYPIDRLGRHRRRNRGWCPRFCRG